MRRRRAEKMNMRKKKKKKRRTDLCVQKTLPVMFLFFSLGAWFFLLVLLFLD